jgi:Ulp1 family protease
MMMMMMMMMMIIIIIIIIVIIIINNVNSGGQGDVDSVDVIFTGFRRSDGKTEQEETVRPFSSQSSDEKINVTIQQLKNELKTNIPTYFNDDNSDSNNVATIDDNSSDGHAQTFLDSRFRALEQADEERVQSILDRCMIADEDTFQDKFNMKITGRKLRCLKPSTWLNDEVINFYMKMLQERDDSLCEQNENRRHSHFFNSFFAERLLATDRCYTYKNVKRWSKKLDIFEMDKIFFPINIGNMHWTLAVVYPQKKRIEYFDSMRGKGAFYTDALFRWIQDEAVTRGLNINMEEWTTYSRSHEIPQQGNGFDCGVFTIIAADFLSDNLPLLYSQSDMESFRLKIILRILNGCLDYPFTSST